MTASEPGWFLMMTHSRAVPPSDSSPQARSTQSASTPSARLSQPIIWTSMLLALAPQADDPVARDRVAAFGELEGDAGRQALDRDGGALRRRLERRRWSVEPGISASITATSSIRLQRDRLHQRLVVGQMQPPQRLGDRLPAERGGQALDDLVEDLAAERDRLLALLRFDPAADLGARLAGDDVAEPGRLRMLRLGDEDLDLVAIVERRAQRHHPAVDLGADRLVAEIGMDGISEVDRRRALGQLDQLALGGEGEDPVLVHRHPGMLEQLLGAGGMFEDLDQVVDPGMRANRRPACLPYRPSGRRGRARPGRASRGCGSGSRSASARRG